jgi:hypothetical protein
VRASRSIRCELHRKRADTRRYRARRVEMAVCKRCGELFWRTKTSKRLQVYCTEGCQYAYRSRDYRERGIRPPSRLPKAA